MDPSTMLLVYHKIYFLGRLLLHKLSQCLSTLPIFDHSFIARCATSSSSIQRVVQNLWKSKYLELLFRHHFQ